MSDGRWPDGGEREPFVHVPPPSGGTVSWAMGFLVFIPTIGLLLAPILMASLCKPVSRGGPLARQNARGAANWGLTFLAGAVFCLLLGFVLATIQRQGFFPAGIGVLLLVALIVVHLVVTIIGTVKASGGKPFAVPFAIPFLRR